MPDLSQLKLSEGNAEPCYLLKAVYHSKKVKVKWDPNSYTHGPPDDDLYLWVISWKFPCIKNWNIDKKIWKDFKYWGSGIKPVAKRKDGSTTISLDQKIDPIIHLFMPSSIPKILAILHLTQ